MWWFTLGTMLTVSLAVYTFSAAQVYTFSPLVMQRTAEAAAQVRESQQATSGANVAWLTLWPGETIALAPFEIPVPAESTQTTMPAEKQPDRAEFHVEHSLTDVLEFYRAALKDHAWHEVRTVMARPTAPAAGPGNAILVFCRAAQGPALLLAIVNDPATGSTVRLRLTGEQPGPCASADSPILGQPAASPDVPGARPSLRERLLPPSL